MLLRVARSVSIGTIASLWLIAGIVCIDGSACGAEADGFKPIFDGASLEASGWDGDPAFWHVEDGAITAESTQEKPARKNTFLVWRHGDVDDFELKLEFRILEGNSGIQYRSVEEPEKWHVEGYQADIEAKRGGLTGGLFGEGGGGILAKKLEAEGRPAPGWGAHRGLLAGRGEKTEIGADHKRKVLDSLGDPNVLEGSVKKGDWNEYHITAQGYHLVHRVNGRVFADFTDTDPGIRRRSGVLALQLHSGEPTKVQFRNVRLKRLPLGDLKKIVFLAGNKSHGFMGHEHNSGCLLLAKCLNESGLDVLTTVYTSGWPKDPTAVDNADGIVAFSDGQGAHVLNRNLDDVDRLAKKGAGIVLLHYAVEPVGQDPKARDCASFLNWVGGYYEKWLSVNPHFLAEFKELPEHSITRGVKPFSADDEWYFNMRFVDDMKNVTPILTTVPPDSVRNRPDDSHGGNQFVRENKGRPEHVGWAYERPTGGRGFGFTGGHWHWNWANHGFRTTVLNAIVWTVGLDVPEGGVPSKNPTLDDLRQNQDYPEPNNYNWGPVRALLERWK